MVSEQELAIARLKSARARVDELRKRIAESGPENCKEDLELLDRLEEAIQSTEERLATPDGGSQTSHGLVDRLSKVGQKEDE